jgi:hypothetical protein
VLDQNDAAFGQEHCPDAERHAAAQPPVGEDRALDEAVTKLQRHQPGRLARRSSDRNVARFGAGGAV